MTAPSTASARRTGTATVTRWSRSFVAVGVTFAVCWQLAVVLGFDRAATVVLGLQGFVFSVIFGKAYALVPSYFERKLAFPRAPAVHLPLATLGVVASFVDRAGIAFGSGALGDSTNPLEFGLVGSALWLLGCLVFTGTLTWTVRDNPTGRETGTGDAKAHRRRVDRLANAVVPAAVAYLLVGASLLVLETVGVDIDVVPTAGPPVTHLLAAGSGALLVFGIGFRLLPRFFVVTPRPALVALVLPAGTLAPALLAVDFLGGSAFEIGALLQVLAVAGFAVAVVDMYVRSDRRRVGFYAILAGALAGIAVVSLGLVFAFTPAGTVGIGLEAATVTAHYRLASAGFLGLTIVGVTYQFYPPAVATTTGIDDRTALASIVGLAAGLAFEVGGLVFASEPTATLGAVVGLGAAGLYAAVVFAVLLERR